MEITQADLAFLKMCDDTLNIELQQPGPSNRQISVQNVIYH